jgi:hypothetical protein
MEGMSISHYMLREVGKTPDRQPPQQVLGRLGDRRRQRMSLSAAEVIRAERDAYSS